MPNLRDLMQYAPYAAQGVGGLLQHRTAGAATRRLTDAASRAQDTIQAGSTAAMDTLRGTRETQRQTTAPYREAGTDALARLRAGLETGGEFAQPFERPTDFTVPGYEQLENDPARLFRLNEGMKAIKQGANAGGTRFSGATMKSLNDYAGASASQEYANIVDRDRRIFGENYDRAESQFRDNQAEKYSRILEMSDTGQRAAETDVQADSAYGANIATMQKALSEQLADLEIEAANAEAAGDVAKSNSITDTISGILDTVNKTGTAKALTSLFGGGAAAAAGTAGMAAVGGALPLTAVGPATMGIGGLAALGGTVPTVSAAAPISAAAGMGPGAGAAITGLLTNPFTIAAGAALGIGLLVRKAQAHHKADDWVQGFQNPFDAKMAAIDRLAQSGGLTPEDNKAAKAANVADYLQALAEFGKKGADHAKVARQALETFRQRYGDLSQYA